MKSFQQFIIETELRDKEGLGGGTGMSHRGGEKIGSERKKTAAERRRSGKAIGGGKTAPTQDYKPRKDIGKQRSKSEREQQPTRERGSAKLSPREQQKKARAERLAAKSSGKSKKELTKAADKLLTKKTAKKVDPNYKAQKASGYTRIERQKIARAAKRLTRDMRKGVDKPASHYDPKV